MSCENTEAKCCGACFVGTSKATDLVGKIASAAHTSEGRVVISAGGVTFSCDCLEITGELSQLIGKPVTTVYVIENGYLIGNSDGVIAITTK